MRWVANIARADSCSTARRADVPNGLKVGLAKKSVAGLVVFVDRWIWVHFDGVFDMITEEVARIHGLFWIQIWLFARLYRHALVELTGMFRFGSATLHKCEQLHTQRDELFRMTSLSRCRILFESLHWKCDRRPPNKKSDTPKSSGKTTSRHSPWMKPKQWMQKPMAKTSPDYYKDWKAVLSTQHSST